MNEVRVGRVSSINYEAGTVRVVYLDKSDKTTAELPVFCGMGEYQMPQINDAVLVLHLSNDSSIGIVMGRFWSAKNLSLIHIWYSQMSVAVRGLVKTFTPGSVKAGAKMESSVTLSLSYYKIVIDGTTMLEIDKLNGVYIVNGEDILKEVRNMC